MTATLAPVTDVSTREGERANNREADAMEAGASEVGASEVDASEAREAAAARSRALALMALRLPDEVPPREHARRICLGVFRRATAPGRSRLLHIGERASTVVFAARTQPVAFWTIDHAPVLRVLAEVEPRARDGAEHARLLRLAAREVVPPERLGVLRGLYLPAIAASGIARAIVSIAGDGGPRVPLARIARSVEQGCVTWSRAALPGFARDCVAAVLVGAVVLEAVGEGVGLTTVLTRMSAGG